MRSVRRPLQRRRRHVHRGLDVAAGHALAVHSLPEFLGARMTRRETPRYDRATHTPTRPDREGPGNRVPETSIYRVNSIAVTKPTPTDRVYAALHLHDRGLREVAEVLGLGSAYDAITRVKEML